MHQENHIIGLIYDAALDSRLWSKVLAEIVYATQSSTAIFTAIDQLNPHFDFVHTHQIPEHCLAAYQDERINVIDMKLHVPLWQKAGVGGIIHENLKHYATSPIGSDEFIFYDRCLKPTNISRFSGILLEQGKYQWSVFAVHRAPDSMAYTQSELALLERVGKHLRRALQIHRQLSSVKQENRELYQVLQHLNTAVVIVNEQMSLVYSNTAAQRILENSSLLSLDRYGRLNTLQKFQAQLNALIQSALFQDKLVNASQIGGVLGLYQQHSEQPMMLTVAPLSQIQHFQQTDVRARAVLFISQVSEKKQLAEQFIKELYVLSPRELQVCILFFNSLALEEIGEHLGITYQSVRTYVKQIYAKTGCNSQVELFKLLSSFAVEFEHIV